MVKEKVRKVNGYGAAYDGSTPALGAGRPSSTLGAPTITSTLATGVVASPVRNSDGSVGECVGVDLLRPWSIVNEVLKKLTAKGGRFLCINRYESMRRAES